MTRKLHRRMAMSRRLLNHRSAPRPDSLAQDLAAINAQLRAWGVFDARDAHDAAVERQAETERALQADELEAAARVDAQHRARPWRKP